MRILLLNQAFYPDVASSGQHAADLALHLVSAGHEVSVIASRRGYDDAGTRFAARETWQGADIIRISMLGFGKGSRWRRALDFASFSANCLRRMLLLPRFDLVIAMTSPPLISALGAFLVRLKGGKFLYWVMDLNPDQAIAAGWIEPQSRMARVLGAILKYSLRHANHVITLDQFMSKRLMEKGVPEDRITAIPPWSHDEAIEYTPEGRQEFRERHGLNGKFVVMYSGNHSPCHPLHSVLESARRLRSRTDIAFVFAGGGSEFRRVGQYAAAHGLSNVRCIPYQPLNQLSASLSAADMHLVVMGDPFVGIVHPCKVYNIRRLGVPFLYIGPDPSHVSDLGPAGSFRHGDVDGIVGFLSARASVRMPLVPDAGTTFSQRALLGRMLRLIESLMERPAPELRGCVLPSEAKEES